MNSRLDTVEGRVIKCKIRGSEIIQYEAEEMDNVSLSLSATEAEYLLLWFIRGPAEVTPSSVVGSVHECPAKDGQQFEHFT